MASAYSALFLQGITDVQMGHGVRMWARLAFVPNLAWAGSPKAR